MTDGVAAHAPISPINLCQTFSQSISNLHCGVSVSSSGVASEVAGVKLRASSTRAGGGRDGRDCDVDGTSLGALLEDIIARDQTHRTDRLHGNVQGRRVSE